MILVTDKTRLLVQGITGKQGSFHAKLMLEYGTNVVSGVTPGKGGQTIHGIPVYDTVEEAVDETGANSSIVFVPAQHAYQAILEAIMSKLDPIVIVTEHIPIHDTVKLIRAAEVYGVRLIGPNTPGLIVPGKVKVGIMPAKYFKEGRVAIVSRSGTLTYEVAYNLTKKGIGQSIVIGCGGDPVTGTSFTDIFKLLREDDETRALVVIGEIGGVEEEKLAEYIVREGFDKPVVAFIAGRAAPPGKRMGHAGAIISMGTGTYESKFKAFEKAGVPIAETPMEIPYLIKELI